MNPTKPILLIEDDQIDVMSIKRAIKHLNITNQLIVKNNGEEALEYFSDSSCQRPLFIISDINMPKMNGIEFLKKIKSNEHFKQIPVLMLTSSSEESDKIDSYDSGVSAYIIKPTTPKKFTEAMRVIELYWTLSEQPYAAPC